MRTQEEIQQQLNEIERQIERTNKGIRSPRNALKHEYLTEQMATLRWVLGWNWDDSAIRLTND
jgi:hypothetical protein